MTFHCEYSPVPHLISNEFFWIFKLTFLETTTLALQEIVKNEIFKIKEAGKTKMILCVSSCRWLACMLAVFGVATRGPWHAAAGGPSWSASPPTEYNHNKKKKRERRGNDYLIIDLVCLKMRPLIGMHWISFLKRKSTGQVGAALRRFWWDFFLG